MAAVRVSSGTTNTNVVTLVNFTTWYPLIRITNRGAKELWVRVDGVNPTVAGDDCDVVLPGDKICILNNKPGPDTAAGTIAWTDVRLISAVKVDYTVTGVPYNRGMNLL